MCLDFTEEERERVGKGSYMSTLIKQSFVWRICFKKSAWLAFDAHCVMEPNRTMKRLKHIVPATNSDEAIVATNMHIFV